MYKDLKFHHAMIASLIPTASKEQAKELLEYHNMRIRDFQHERLIHLLVTLFFAGILVASIVAVFVSSQNNTSGFITACLSIVTALLLVTEVCYIGYYYLLENGVQKLYGLTKELHNKVKVA